MFTYLLFLFIFVVVVLFCFIFTLNVVFYVLVEIQFLRLFILLFNIFLGRAIEPFIQSDIVDKNHHLYVYIHININILYLNTIVVLQKLKKKPNINQGKE